MKIGQPPEIASALQQTTQTAQAQAKQQARAAAPLAQATTQSGVATRSGAAVTFSNAARSLDSATRSQGDFDLSKVKAMREAIEKGEFKINPEAIADKLLSNAREALEHSRI